MLKANKKRFNFLIENITWKFKVEGFHKELTRLKMGLCGGGSNLSTHSLGGGQAPRLVWKFVGG